jgi:hypothetical protein
MCVWKVRDGDSITTRVHDLSVAFRTPGLRLLGKWCSRSILCCLGGGLSLFGFLIVSAYELVGSVCRRVELEGGS